MLLHLHLQDEAKLRQVQAQCLAGQLARGEREKGMSPGQLAVHRLSVLLAERLAQQVFLNRRTQLMHMGARAALSPLAASPVAQRDGTSRPASVRAPPPAPPACASVRGHPLLGPCCSCRGGQAD